MAENWAADVKKFAPDADDGVIAAIVRYCGIALQNRDSSLVSFTDAVETGRVRENFLKKKLGLVQSDSVLDEAIAAVGQRMKGVNFKNRVTVYYLLLEHFGLLHLFGGKPADSAGIAAAAGATGAAALGLAGTASAVSPPSAEPVVSNIPAPEIASPAAPAMAYAAGEGEEKSGIGWWPWLLLALLVLALLWWFFLRPAPAPMPAGDGRTYSTTGGEAVSGDVAGGPDLNASGAANASAAADLSVAPAEGSVTIPIGAGVTTETRDGKPVVKVYFDTAKTEVAPAFAAAAGGLKVYLAAHAGTSLAVSGYNDKTGNAAANAELSKNRAQAVKAALVSAGIADGSVALVKPSDTTDASGSDAAARRVEVVVK